MPLLTDRRLRIWGSWVRILPGAPIDLMSYSPPFWIGLRLVSANVVPMAEGSDLALLIRTLHPLLGSLLLVQREMRWQGAAAAIRKPHIGTTRHGRA